MRRTDLLEYPIGSPDGGVRAFGRRFEDPLSAIGAVTGLVSAAGSFAKADAANNAADAQVAAAQAGEAGIQKRFDALQELLKPYVTAGTGALGGMQALTGLSGADAQQSAIDAIKASPAFTSLLSAGETSLLQNASATGGLRGGNTQAALAQFSPQLLAQMIEQQYSKLGGIAQMGQASAAGVGSAGMSAGSQIAQLMQQAGAAQAGGALAQGNAWGSIPNALGSALGIYKGLGGTFGGGGGGSPSNADIERDILGIPGKF